MCMVDHSDGIMDLTLPDHIPPKELSAALLRTCRAIYEETMPILYGNQRLEIMPKDDLKQCLDTLSAPAKANIKELVIILDECCCDVDGLPGLHCKLQDCVLIHVADNRDSLALLEGLKRVTLECNTCWTKCEKVSSEYTVIELDRPPHETFLESLGAKVEHDHSLYVLMKQLPHHDLIEWYFDLTSGEYWFGEDGRLWRKMVRVKSKVSVQKNGRSVERWVVEKISESTWG